MLSFEMMYHVVSILAILTMFSWSAYCLFSLFRLQAYMLRNVGVKNITLTIRPRHIFAVIFTLVVLVTYHFMT